MEVSLTPEVETELAAIASKTGRTIEQLAAEALRKGLAEERQYLAAIEQGIASADAGRLVDDEAVLAWLEQQESRELG